MIRPLQQPINYHFLWKCSDALFLNLPSYVLLFYQLLLQQFRTGRNVVQRQIRKEMIAWYSPIGVIKKILAENDFTDLTEMRSPRMRYCFILFIRYITCAKVASLGGCVLSALHYSNRFKKMILHRVNHICPSISLSVWCLSAHNCVRTTDSPTWLKVRCIGPKVLFIRIFPNKNWRTVVCYHEQLQWEKVCLNVIT